MDDTDTQRLFEGEALLRRMYKYGLLEEGQNKLDYVLALSPQDFLERRLQTLVFKLGLAKSIHHARVLIRQRHIRSVCATCPTGVFRSSAELSLSIPVIPNHSQSMTLLCFPVVQVAESVPPPWMLLPFPGFLAPQVAS